MGWFPIASVAEEHSAPDPDLTRWLDGLRGVYNEADVALVARAAGVARQAHATQRRASGEPYFTHVLAVAQILAGLRMDAATIAAALLHDVVEDTAIDLAELRREFGDDIATMVDGVTRMAHIAQHAAEATDEDPVRHAEGLRKLLLAMAQDVRVVLIKLADRLHNLRTLGHLPEDRRRRIARETLDIHAPLANRLGIWQLKWELEDLAFRHLDPENWARIDALLAERHEERQGYVREVTRTLGRECEKLGVRAEISGRSKHIYSIWRKMRRKGVDFHRIFDVHAVRVLVDDVAACYTVLGAVHTLWKHIPGEFDDYIANPKDNHYSSLHTAVIGPEGRTLEVQIRTHEMHRHAEYGIAAHWRYKEGGGGRDAAYEERIAWLRRLLELREEGDDAGDFIDRFKAEVFHDRVYALTPRGRVIDLPRGATALDFAYHVHTDIGHRCRGAKVNGHMVPLARPIESGESVEIITQRHGEPSRDWLSPHLGYLHTPRARAKVRAWFRQRDHEKNVVSGRQILEREARRLGLPLPEEDRLLKRFHLQKVEEMYSAIGRGDLGLTQIATALEALSGVPVTAPAPVSAPPVREMPSTGGVQVEGVGNLLTQMARCCRPVPGDAIIGYITRDHGVTIHRQDCANFLRMKEANTRRVIEVDWGSGPGRVFTTPVEVIAFDRQGLLRDITTLLANEKVNVIAVDTRTTRPDNIARMRLTVEVRDLAQLAEVLDRIGRIPNVSEVRRAV